MIGQNPNILQNHNFPSISELLKQEIPPSGGNPSQNSLSSDGGHFEGHKAALLHGVGPTELWNIEHLSWRKICFEGFARNNV